jgi:hypothetical protein
MLPFVTTARDSKHLPSKIAGRTAKAPAPWRPPFVCNVLKTTAATMRDKSRRNIDDDRQWGLTLGLAVIATGLFWLVLGLWVRRFFTG